MSPAARSTSPQLGPHDSSSDVQRLLAPRQLWQQPAADDLDQRDAEDESSTPPISVLGRSLSRSPSRPRRFRVPLRRRALGMLCGALGILVLFVCVNTILPHPYRGSSPAKSKPFIYSKAAVASEVPQCSTIGKDVLADGGSAVDAAIAAALCVGSINSFASGIGGGGFMVIRHPQRKRVGSGNAESIVIDFRETAPAAINEQLFGNNSQLSRVGGLSVGVPGELRGLEHAHKKYGRLPWSRLLEPIIKLNRDGFPATKALQKRLEVNKDWVLASDTWREVFAPTGKLVLEGEIVKRPAMAKTFEEISKRGAQALYEGAIAEAIVDEVQRNGGVMTLADLANYTAVEREPVEAWYKGRRIISAPAPASGHVLIFILNILERFDLALKGRDDLNVHRIVEAMRYGFARRSELGDPDFLKIRTRLDEILTKEYAAVTRRNVTDDTTHEPAYYNPQFENAESHGTTHLSVVDEDDMAVSLTSTVNLIFGSRLMNRETGIVLNDQIDDFSFQNFSNAFGLPPSPSNFIVPGKRPMSSTCPTIIERDGMFEVAVGASGGSRIISAVLQTILNYVDFDQSITDAVTYPRLHDQLYPDVCEVEDGFPEQLAAGLEQRHHKLQRLAVGYHESVAQAVARLQDGRVEAVSDYRKSGAPDGV
ncbi:hypothetical protein RI367_006113 [Sorochytrium milnesiophthora]